MYTYILAAYYYYCDYHIGAGAPGDAGEEAAGDLVLAAAGG